MYYSTYFIIKQTNPHHCDYYYEGPTKSGNIALHYNKSRAKLYSSVEEANRDKKLLETFHSTSEDTWTVETVRKKAQNI